MTNEKPSQPKDMQTRPRTDDVWQFGYQPKDVTPVNVASLKPPRGGSAVKPPQRPVAKDSQ